MPAKKKPPKTGGLKTRQAQARNRAYSQLLPGHDPERITQLVTAVYGHKKTKDHCVVLVVCGIPKVKSIPGLLDAGIKQLEETPVTTKKVFFRVDNPEIFDLRKQTKKIERDFKDTTGEQKRSPDTPVHPTKEVMVSQAVSLLGYSFWGFEKNKGKCCAKGSTCIREALEANIAPGVGGTMKSISPASRGSTRTGHEKQNLKPKSPAIDGAASAPKLNLAAAGH